MLLRLSLSFALSILMTSASVAETGSAPVGPAEVAKAVKRLVDREFYRPVTFPSFDGKQPTFRDIDDALAALGTSHTRRIPPGTIDYAELADILKRGIKDDLRKAFPAMKGEPSYVGIGAIVSPIDGKNFISDIYESSPAAGAGLRVGDEVIAVDGASYDEIRSYKDKAGKEVTLSIRRDKDGPSRDIAVRAETIQPNRVFARALSSSMKVVESRGFRLGYFRLWALGTDDIEETIYQALSDGKLADVDGLMVDLRGRWGGMFSQVPEVLFNIGPEITFTGRSGKVSYARRRFDKPIVAIVDEGTRSAQEMFAHLMQKRGAIIVGKRTAGAVLAVGAWMLPDTSLLVLPISEVRIDGQRLEGVGVPPDIEVDFPLPYAAGNDPQFDAAVTALGEQLCVSASNGKDARQCSEGIVAP